MLSLCEQKLLFFESWEHLLPNLDIWWYMQTFGFTSLTAILPVMSILGEPVFSMMPFDALRMMSQSEKNGASQEGKEEAEKEEDHHRSAPDVFRKKTLKVKKQMFWALNSLVGYDKLS